MRPTEIAMRKRSRKTVLIVSREIPDRSALVAMLHAGGYNVATAADSAEALGLIREQSVDVVAADISPPAHEGLALLEELHQATVKLPVVVVTGVSDVELYLEAMNRGAFDYLVQPLSAKEFLSVVRKALSWSPRRRQAA